VSDWWRVVHPADTASLRERLQDLVWGRSGSNEIEHRMVQRDGAIRWFLTRAACVKKADAVTRIIGTYTDITERKRSEHTLHEVQVELARVSRLTALGELAGSIAHELRQPLTAII